MTTTTTSTLERTPAGRLRKLAALLTTPLVPEDFLDLVRPLRSSTDLRGCIEAITPETPDVATVRIRPGRGWRTPIAGQYVRIGVDVDGVRRWRSYSVSGPEDTGGCFTITVKCVPDGIVSTHLVRAARVGTVVQLDQPAGDFVLPAPRPAKVLFVTAGSGITPVMGMLRQALPELADLTDIVLVHCAPTAADAIFGAEIRALAADGRLRLVEIHTRTASRLTPEALTALVPDLPERQTWACGPAALLDSLEAHYAAAGQADRLHTERFQAALITTGIGGTVTFHRSRTTVAAAGATSLLDAGENAGVLMPSGCRMGVCFGCVVPLRQGAVRDLRNGAITSANPGDGVLVQTCVSAAAGTCELDV